MSQKDLQFSQELISSEVYEAMYQDITSDGQNMLEIMTSSQIFGFETQEHEEQEQKHVIWPEQGFEHLGIPVDDNQFPIMPTMDSTLTVPQNPTNVEFTGDLNFNIKITTPQNSRNPWIYSTLLKKVYININTTLPVEIACNSLPTGDELFIRATPLYSLAQYAHEFVQRCTTHSELKQPNNQGIEPHIAKHIIRCSNHGSFYSGNIDKKDRLSVRTPLPPPQAGVDTVRINYEFVCKNSCPSGMNRRAIDIIYTLENTYGQVLGRRKLGVRICSCPKRDKEKDELEFKDEMRIGNHEHNGPSNKKKRKLLKISSTNDTANGGKKVLDNTLIKLPALELTGYDVAKDTVRFARDRLIAEIHDNRFDSVVEKQVKEQIKKLDITLKDLEKE